MKHRYFSPKVNEQARIEAGNILIAMPFWKRELYHRVVILIIEHNSMGTTGLLLNRKSTLLISEAIPSLEIKKPLFFGGESDTKIISYLHNNYTIPDSIYMGNNLFWGGNFEIVSELIYNKMVDLNEFNFYAGFVTWEAGQLEEEIDAKKWQMSKLTDTEIFRTPSDDLWAASLENMGNLYSLFSNVPDPSIN